MSNSCRVLVVDRDASIVKNLLQALREGGFETYGTCNPRAASAIIPQFPLDAVVAGASSAAGVITGARAATRKCRILLLSATAPDPELQKLAQEAGAALRTAPVDAFASEALNFVRSLLPFHRAA